MVRLAGLGGPAAAITAVPGLIFFHTIALHVPGLRPVGILLASEGVPTVRRGLAAGFLPSRFSPSPKPTPPGTRSPPKSASNSPRIHPAPPPSRSRLLARAA